MSVNHELYNAINEGDVEAVRVLLKIAKAEDLNCKDEAGDSVLIEATRCNLAEIVEMLLTHPGTDVNQHNNQGDTALIEASNYGRTDVTQILLTHRDIKVNMQNERGETALMNAARDSYVEMVNMLLAHPDIDVNLQKEYDGTVLHQSVCREDTEEFNEIVKVLLAHPTTDVTSEDQFGSTALNNAAFHGYAEMVQILMNHPKVDVNMLNSDGKTALMKACYGGHVETVKVLLAHPDINIHILELYEYGQTALLQASCPEVVELLLAHPGIDVDQQNKQGWTAILKASERGQTAIVKTLLAHPGIQSNLPDKRGLTALKVAFQNNHAEIVEMLLPQDKVSISNSLYVASFKGDEKTVRELLKKATAEDLCLNKETGETALMAASYVGHANIVQMLLAHPAVDVNIQDQYGGTALFWASDTGQTKVVELLLSHPGTDDGLLTKTKITALVRASYNRHIEIVKMLLARPGVEVNLQAEDGHSIFMMNVGNTEVAEIMLARPDIDVNFQDKNGETALMTASYINAVEVVALLLARKSIDINTQDMYGSTALMWAMTCKATETVRLLLAHPGINVFLQDQLGVTALMAASRMGGTEIVHMLLSLSDININHRDEAGNTALFSACKAGHVSIVEKLLAHPDIAVDMNNNSGESAIQLTDNEEIKALFRARAANVAAESPTKTRVTWLAARLLESGVDEQLVKDCELKLLVQEGLVTETDFAELLPTDVDVAYLKNIGISGKGVQVKIIKLHRELHAQYSPPSQSTTPLKEQKSKEVPSVFHCGAIVIQDLEPLVADATSLHGATSSRLLLRGRFSSSITDLGKVYTKDYSCVVKCAADADSYQLTDSEGAKAIRRELSMYEHVEESTRTKGFTTTGCIACYHMHPSAHYLVLESFGQDIRHLLDSSFKFAPQLAESIIAAVAALHSLGVMHGDIKPHNLLYTFDHNRGYVAKLCDLDCAYKAGEVCAATALGTKQYEAPEVYFASLAGETVTAALSIDMFSLGVLLWQVLNRSRNPPVSVEHLHECYSDQAKMSARLTLPEQSVLYTPLLHSITTFIPPERITAETLYKKMRDIAASKAQQNWHKEKQENAFLKEVVSDKLDGLDKQLQALRQGQEMLGVQVGRVLHDNKKLDTMMRTLIAGTHSIPTYAIILPIVATTWRNKVDPMRLVRHQYRLYFLCSHTHQIAPCGPKGEGYKITVTKQWVRDAAPVLMAALFALKLALMAGGLPLPIPDLSPLLDSPALHVKYLDAALHLVKNPLEDNSKESEFAMGHALSLLESVGLDDVLCVQDQGGVSLEEGSLKAYATIQGVLKTENIDIALTSGLRQVVHPVTGKTAWVLDNDAVVQQYFDSVPGSTPTNPIANSSTQAQPLRDPVHDRSTEQDTVSAGCKCTVS